eukprot:scaffold168635_cov37-Prasinocladus_malaysianus.AAC.1
MSGNDAWNAIMSAIVSADFQPAALKLNVTAQGRDTLARQKSSSYRWYVYEQPNLLIFYVCTRTSTMGLTNISRFNLSGLPLALSAPRPTRCQSSLQDEVEAFAVYVSFSEILFRDCWHEDP